MLAKHFGRNKIVCMLSIIIINIFRRIKKLKSKMCALYYAHFTKILKSKIFIITNHILGMYI